MRSILRYIEEIKVLFNLNISYKNLEYKLEEDPTRNAIYKAFRSTIISNNIFETLAYNSSLAEHIDLDIQNSSGFQHVAMVLQAIESRKKLQIELQEFYSDEPNKPIVIRPYLLKSYLNRFYVIGVDDRYSLEYKRFSLDKIKSIVQLEAVFQEYDLQKLKDHYREIVGITTYSPAPPIQEVQLKFIEYQFKYFESEAWFQDYTIIDGNPTDKEVTISFYARRNNDLSQRILSYTDKVVVLKPKEVVDEVRIFLQNALNYYI
jgi:predicted DNA-binding transcriptional regulator YafY